MSGALGWTASFLSGTVLWAAATTLSGRQEPWDAAEYWTIFLPAAYFLCGLLGFAFPNRTWRWPLAVMFAQLPVMFLRTGEIGSMVGAGIVIALLLSLPGIAAAAAGGYVRGKLTAA